MSEEKQAEKKEIIKIENELTAYSEFDQEKIALIAKYEGYVVDTAKIKEGKDARKALRDYRLGLQKHEKFINDTLNGWKKTNKTRASSYIDELKIIEDRIAGEIKAIEEERARALAEKKAEEKRRLDQLRADLIVLRDKFFNDIESAESSEALSAIDTEIDKEVYQDIKEELYIVNFEVTRRKSIRKSELIKAEELKAQEAEIERQKAEIKKREEDLKKQEEQIIKDKNLARQKAKEAEELRQYQAVGIDQSDPALELETVAPEEVKDHADIADTIADIDDLSDKIKNERLANEKVGELADGSGIFINSQDEGFLYKKNVIEKLKEIGLSALQAVEMSQGFYEIRVDIDEWLILNKKEIEKFRAGEITGISIVGTGPEKSDLSDSEVKTTDKSFSDSEAEEKARKASKYKELIVLMRETFLMWSNQTLDKEVIARAQLYLENFENKLLNIK